MGYPQLLALFKQGIQVFVTVVRGLDNEVVEHQIITGTVANQNLAVTVQDVAPGGSDGGDGGVQGGVVGVAVGIDDLQLKQPHGVQHHDEGKEPQENTGSQFGYSFHT